MRLPIVFTPQPSAPNYLALQLPLDATSTLYIEGLPADASEREVAHIFRRYEGHGFQSIRMRGIESARSPGTTLFLCFAEFDNAHQATIAMYGLQVTPAAHARRPGLPLFHTRGLNRPLSAGLSF